MRCLFCKTATRGHAGLGRRAEDVVVKGIQLGSLSLEGTEEYSYQQHSLWLSKYEPDNKNASSLSSEYSINQDLAHPTVFTSGPNSPS